MQLGTMVYMQTVPRLYEIFQPTHYDLQLDLDRENRRFSGHVTITGEKTDLVRPLTFHSKDLTITSVQVDDTASVPYTTTEFDQLVIDTDVVAGTHTVTLTFDGT